MTAGNWIAIISPVVTLLIGIAMLTYTRLTTPYYNRIDEQLKNAATVNNSEQEKIYLELRQINDKLTDIKTERKDDKTELASFRASVITLREDIIKLQSQWHQISQAIGDVDADKTKDISHLKEIFEMYKSVLDHFMNKK